jgi:hypothetical protein
LRKRLLESSFEMSVLNAVNNKGLEEMKQVMNEISTTLDKDLTAGKISLQNCENVIKFKETVITEVIIPTININQIDNNENNDNEKEDENESITVDPINDHDLSFDDGSDDISIGK